MSNVRIMWEFFDIVDDIITEMAGDDQGISKILKYFFIRILSVCDGLEGAENWKGIALVAQEDLPSNVEEINDGFLHEMWADREESE